MKDDSADRVRFGVIQILDLLNPECGYSDRIGWRVHEEIEQIALHSTPQVSVRYERIASRNDFLAALNRAAQETRTSGKSHLLHIDIHGSQSTTLFYGVRDGAAQRRWPSVSQ